MVKFLLSWWIKAVTFFVNKFKLASNFITKDLLHCIYLWALETSIVSATAQLAVSATTLVDFYNFFREVCSTALNRNPVQLGGPGRIVQIDESLFAHKPKYRWGRPAQSEIWVFGMADCTSNPALENLLSLKALKHLPEARVSILNSVDLLSDIWKCLWYMAAVSIRCES